MTTSPLVSTQWLEDHLNSPDIVVLDGSLYLPQMGRDADAEFNEGHIPGAIRFDIDDVSNSASGLPHTLPEPHVFASKMRKLGIGDGQTIVVYDGIGLWSAARVWWMFKVMGVKDVYVLDGGLPKWTEEGRPLEDGPVQVRERHFTARLDRGAVSNLDDVKKIIETKSRQIIDARAAERFSGEAPEPRAGMRSGHMPGALNVPVMSLTREDGTLKDAAELRVLFEEAGVDITKPATTTCGSGVTAAALTLALTTLGATDLTLYDGSWSEWGGREDTDVVSGA
ncbi:thiosulfate/3-mercaptopyruvate sulfurtransferase [Roseibium hamelinense]|uniref:3-mercaptopyruvate sulfurtransferase n=1 Tax=Roseibium hamelinense TaxID=150831 RepID=A0A562TJ74_9HYPH|nr:3-mercaptopyruvate sulfurtransferase [Roseibium hamelinense]MTI46067.1 3-mercaptopyruvate sulfurtransferase [Roseibium hamelinense]TWI92740.1 thiosulfate/3-mercaptopyruvate sulfurtransferase [Roseibium hamelinense]